MNNRKRIKLNKIEEIGKFTNLIRELASDVDIICGHYVIDAKSVLGIYTLDLSKVIEIFIHTDEELELILFDSITKEYEVL